MWLLFIGIFTIIVCETRKMEADPTVFSPFRVIFEVVSAYSNVGMSFGLPTASYSFCGAWHNTSKILLAVVMILGRQRALPSTFQNYLALG